ncbi:hypothetical protein [Ferrimonas marina]|uniref:Uncharacterized protein n=1 Tax=Ferrimonas marina TaxID=299255 RepID=A0A1M5QWB0_9GAMM|nr:hypothetical protein [Ferrimonas marina]SHH17833.1 hypothetical protein SAMN02745129_1367 [Ferrimonas marina]
MKRHQLLKELKRVAGQLRTGQTLAANAEIKELMPHIVKQFPKLEVERLEQAKLLFPELSACMERSDYLGLADYFEYELVELFS